MAPTSGSDDSAASMNFARIVPIAQHRLHFVLVPDLQRDSLGNRNGRRGNTRMNGCSSCAASAFAAGRAATAFTVSSGVVASGVG
jgi:hypothetical protein